jgi:hypothetical protein
MFNLQINIIYFHLKKIDKSKETNTIRIRILIILTLDKIIFIWELQIFICEVGMVDKLPLDKSLMVGYTIQS